MIQLSFHQVFGKNSYQDANSLVIAKSDLIGLTVSANNTAKALLVAMLLTTHRNFEGNIEDKAGNAITDELGRKLTFNNSGLYEVLNVFYWKRQFLTIGNQAKILDTFVVENYKLL